MVTLKHKDDEEALRLFFQHNPTDDTFYLKNYVKQHPDNKMAWYFLGRDYELKGKKSKALYCFAQAGEVYEAFESESLPLLPAHPDQHRNLHRKKRMTLSSSARKLALIAAALFLLLYIPGSPAKMPNRSTEGSLVLSDPYNANNTATLPALKRPNIDELPISDDEGENGGQVLFWGEMEYDSIGLATVYYLTGANDQAELVQAIRQMTLPRKDTSPPYSFVIQPAFSPDDRWREWLGATRILLAAQHHAGNETTVQYLNEELCQCKSSGSVSSYPWLEYWQEQQESGIVLRSGIYAYAMKYGEWPNSIDDLIKPYPHNLLPGYTPVMERQFAASLNDVSAGFSDLTSLEEISTLPKEQRSLEGAMLEPLSAPLQIVIDKQTYRLALISGDVILRSYPVGLGGERTPEGEFAITEKVRNPNGRSDGEFGSRGMTLSETLYAIHGTNQPDSVERDLSLGCIRMNNEHIEELFNMVPLGTPVKIGNGLLPRDSILKERPFQVPVMANEENPHKTYRWLN